MNKRQIARKLVDTEARIKLLKRQLELALQKAIDLMQELEKPSQPDVRLVKQVEDNILERRAS